MPCLKASGLCDIVVIMTTINSGCFKPVYDPCRMNVLEASHDLVDDELHLKLTGSLVNSSRDGFGSVLLSVTRVPC